jgi:hypothetical protein
MKFRGGYKAIRVVISAWGWQFNNEARQIMHIIVAARHYFVVSGVRCHAGRDRDATLCLCAWAAAGFALASYDENLLKE